MGRRRWIKLWTQETLFGTTSEELNLEQQAIWFKMLALAGDSPIPGVICVAPGVPYPLKTLSEVLKAPLKTVKTAIEVMVSVGKLTYENGILKVAKWEHYQADYERVRKFRNGVTNETPTPSVTSVTSLPEEEEEGRERGGGTPPHPTSPSPTTTAPPETSKNFGAFCQIFESNIGMLSPILAQELEQLSLDYSLQWFEEAVKEACLMNKRALKYIIAILDRWGREGFKAPMGRKTGMPTGRPPKSHLPDGKELKEAWKPTSS